MEPPKISNGIPMELLWKPHRTPMEIQWKSSGISKEFLWKSYELNTIECCMVFIGPNEFIVIF